MPGSTVEVDIIADATQAKATIADLTRSVDASTARMQSDFAQVNAVSFEGLAATGKAITAAMAKLGMQPTGATFGRMDPQSQMAVAAYNTLQNKVNETNKDIKETGTSMEEAGRKGSSAFEKIEGMISRMMIRLIAFKLIFDAIKAVTDTIGESVGWQAFSARFEALTGDIASAKDQLAGFEQQAKEIGVDAEAIGNTALQLQKVGENASEAAQDASTLNAYAAASGESADKLTAAFQRVRLGTGTLEDMRELVFLEGEAGRATLKQINALEQYKAQLSLIETAENRLYTLEERRVGELQRQDEAVEGFSSKMGIVEDVWRRVINHQSTANTHLHIFRNGAETASINLSAAGQAMGRMLTIGQQRIMQEEGLNSTQMKQLAQAGLITASDVMQAYHRKIADDQRQREWAHEDQQYNRRMALIKAEWTLNEQITKEIRAGVGLQALMAKHAQTAEAAIKGMQEAFKNIARDLPGLATAMGNLAKEAERIANAIDKIITGAKKPEWDWPLKTLNPQYQSGQAPEWDWPAKIPGVRDSAQFLREHDQSLLGILLKIYEHQVQVFGTGH